MTSFVKSAFTLIESCDDAVAKLISRERRPEETPDEFVAALINPILVRIGGSYEPRVLQSLIAIVSSYFADALSSEMQAKLHAMDVYNTPAGMSVRNTSANAAIFNADKTALTFDASEVADMSKAQLRAVIIAIEDMNEADSECFLRTCPVPTMNELIKRGYRADVHVYLIAQLQRVVDETYVALPDANLMTVYARIVHKWPRIVGDATYTPDLKSSAKIACKVGMRVRYVANSAQISISEFNNISVRDGKIKFEH